MSGDRSFALLVREPEGNGVAERFIRTLKENLLWVRTFDTIEELRAALIEFATPFGERVCLRQCCRADRGDGQDRSISHYRCLISASKVTRR